jgi:hypothetical protein
MKMIISTFGVCCKTNSISHLKTDKVYTVLLGGVAAKGAEDTTKYNHYSILRTVENNWGLDSLKRGDAEANPFKL